MLSEVTPAEAGVLRGTPPQPQKIKLPVLVSERLQELFALFPSREIFTPQGHSHRIRTDGGSPGHPTGQLLPVLILHGVCDPQ